MAAAFDYSPLAATALRLVTKFGRPVTIKFPTDAPPVDPTRPWEPADPTFVSYVTVGVVTPVEEGYVNHEDVLETDEQVIVAGKGLPAVPTPKAVVLDGATQYKTVKVEAVDPGPTPLAYIIFVRR